MAKFLAILSDSIDDIEINGFVVMSEKDMNNYEDLAYSITWPFSYQLGSEKIHYSSGEDLLTRIEFKELTADEVKMLKKTFNNEFGVFISEEFLKSVADGDEGDEEDWGEDDDSDDRDLNDRTNYGFDDEDDY
jgi:hypothetical protein